MTVWPGSVLCLLCVLVWPDPVLCILGVVGPGPVPRILCVLVWPDPVLYILCVVRCMLGLVKKPGADTQEVFFLPCGGQADAFCPLTCPHHKCRRKSRICDVMMRSLDALVNGGKGSKEGFVIHVHQPPTRDKAKVRVQGALAFKSGTEQ